MEPKKIDRKYIELLIVTSPDLPVSAKELAATARRRNIPQNVIEFFETIPEGEAFSAEEEIWRRAEEAGYVRDRVLVSKVRRGEIDART